MWFKKKMNGKLNGKGFALPDLNAVTSEVFAK